ncbi:16S rRNA (guanine(966)-N(2))-methyltransferase RsmD [Paracoccus sp. (in: a-proteobacteria)]|uniref:16S rRNA (guanine(966)-N(2))-methyltransferase RsmD n=1 Tax=Paracoccus sp. TaxID=267 RepID=UPI00396C78F3
MRIVGGRLRGLKLAELREGDIAAHLRPTTDRVREAIFNLLINGGHGNPLPGARVLDLFAGTGALGLEALSRGAAQAVLVDDGAKARSLIRQNIEKARLQDVVRHLSRDATRLQPNRDVPFDLVFLDPPYAQARGEAALASALAGGWLSPDATVVWEEAVPPVLPAGFRPLDQRRYGDTVVTLARRMGSA